MKCHHIFIFSVKICLQTLSNDHLPASCSMWAHIWKTFKGQWKQEASHAPLSTHSSVSSGKGGAQGILYTHWCLTGQTQISEGRVGLSLQPPVKESLQRVSYVAAVRKWE